MQLNIAFLLDIASEIPSRQKYDNSTQYKKVTSRRNFL